MKIALSYTIRFVFTNFRKRKISKKNKHPLRNFSFKLMFFLISIAPFYCFSNSYTLESKTKKKAQTSLYQTDSLNLTKSTTSLDVNTDTDTDGDGVIDIVDLDDDNDGILDDDEGFHNLHSLRNEGIIITINGAWVLVFTSVYFDLPSDLKHGDEFWVPFLGSHYVKAVRIKFENTENGIRFTQTATKHTIGNDPELDTDLNYDFDNGGIIAPVAISDDAEGYGIASIEYKDKIIIPEYLSESGKEWIVAELDTDNDGLIDSRDTDSDNDGCSDASEGQDNLTTTATLSNGSNGGSLGNLGVISNINGIPLPLGTVNGTETVGQSNTKTALTSEHFTVSSLVNVTAKAGDNITIPVTASAVKTVTYNLGVPNYSDPYGIDTSDLISYKWYREDNSNTIVSTSKELIINDINVSKSGTYILEVKSSGNSCIVKKSVSITVDGILGGIENLEKFDNSFKAYPNPTKGNVNLLLFSKEASEAVIALFDITGKEIFSETKKLTSGKNEISLNLKVKPGVLFLKVVSRKTNYGTSKIFFR